MNDAELKIFLLEANLLNPEEIEKALGETQKLKRPLERVVLDMHLLEKESLYKVISERIGIEYRNLAGLEVAPELLKIYSEELARSTKSVPLFIKDDVLHIAMEDPMNVSLIDQVQLFTNYAIEVLLSSPDEIE